MSLDGVRVCVVGGGSRIAAALDPLLGDTGYRISRQPGGRRDEIAVRDYDAIAPSMLASATSVVNCVGVSTGSAAHLHRLNVDVPVRLAQAARAVGVRHLIQISSFSVYGGARHVDRSTPSAPTSDYGRSKLAADAGLLALGDDRFTVTILRLPLIYAKGSLGKLGKLGQLLRLWRQMRVLPVPAQDVARAMIGVELTAEVIASLLGDPVFGVVLAADPQPFSYAQAARARPEVLGRLPVPGVLTRLAERAVPAVGGRLFADSRLADVDNLVIGYGLASRLYGDIAAADLR